MGSQTCLHLVSAHRVEMQAKDTQLDFQNPLGSSCNTHRKQDLSSSLIIVSSMTDALLTGATAAVEDYGSNLIPVTPCLCWDIPIIMAQKYNAVMAALIQNLQP